MEIALHVLFGATVGYIIVSVCESFFHNVMGHPPPRFRIACKSAGILGCWVRRAWYSHGVVHHLSTFRINFVTQFKDDAEERKLREKMIRTNRGHVVSQEYGLRVGPFSEQLRYVAPTLPFMFVACLMGLPWFPMGALLPLIIMPLVSQFIHPLIHMRYDDAVAEAGPLLRLIVKSRYFRYVARHHWLHHQDPGVNFNLIPIGDLLLGRYCSPNGEDIVAMARDGLFVADHKLYCLKLPSRIAH